MANLIAFIWFSMLFNSVFSQVQKQKDSPIKNINIDMKTLTLSWTNVENVKNMNCSVIIGSLLEYATTSLNNRECKLAPEHPWCQGVNFTISGTAGNTFSETFPVHQRGKEGPTKEKVSCQIHDEEVMNCNWTVRKIPRDIQYQFFYSKIPDTFVDSECPEYKMDSEGRRVGCHINNISEFTPSQKYHILVNGTSGEMEVQCNDDYIILNEIEIFKPPKISIICKDFNCSMQWQAPKSRQLGLNNFEYQLIIQKVSEKNSNEPAIKIGTRTNFDHRIIDGRYTVKIRTKKLFSTNWSDWSEPQEFGEDPKNNPLLILLVSLLGLVFIKLLIVGYLCKRYMIQKICPPIPHVRDQLSDTFHKYVQVTWEEKKILPEQCKIEVIQIIQKTPNGP